MGNSKSSLKKRISTYIFLKGDILDNDLNKNIIINLIFKLYKKHYGASEYLDWISNDLLVFIGYKIDLEKANDIEGIKLWDELNKKTMLNGKTNKNKIIELLNDVPTYYLMSFLGWAYLLGK